MVIFAMSGSLREGSTNTEILSLIKSLLPKGTEFLMYDGLGQLPHFNPDLDKENVPDSVKELRGMIARSNALIISTPEYAHGVPGSLKNALDWLVSTTVTESKTTGLIFGSATEGSFAQLSLIETLKTMNAHIIPEAILNIPGVRNQLHDNTLSEPLKKFVDQLLSNTVLKS